MIRWTDFCESERSTFSRLIVALIGTSSSSASTARSAYWLSSDGNSWSTRSSRPVPLYRANAVQPWRRGYSSTVMRCAQPSGTAM